jgi:hypothetical protein
VPVLWAAGYHRAVSGIARDGLENHVDSLIGAVGSTNTAVMRSVHDHGRRYPPLQAN